MWPLLFTNNLVILQCDALILQLKRVPILRRLWQAEKDAGRDVTLKDDQEFDIEAAEKADQEREERRQQREGEEGGEGRRRR